MKGLSCFLCLCLGLTIFWGFPARGQAGIATDPARLYYHLPPGSSGIQRVRVSNTGSQPLEVGVSVNDWDYDSLGNNRVYDAGTLKTSCAKWIQVLPGAYFTVPPHESQELTVNLAVPAGADAGVPVHTAMLFFTQLNPQASTQATNGATIKEALRMGVKVYQNYGGGNLRDLEITNFQDSTRMDKDKHKIRFLELSFTNSGKIWLEGTIRWELLDLANGTKLNMKEQRFYSLPGDQRIVIQNLPPGLKQGSKYSVSAIVNYGNKDELKIAELDFQY